MNEIRTLPNTKRTQYCFWDTCVKNSEPQSDEETDKPKMRVILQNNWPMLCKNVKAIKEPPCLRYPSVGD